jgi:MoaD family protein
MTLINVKIQVFYNELVKILGKNEIIVELQENEATISGLLQKLSKKYGDEILRILKKSHSEISILINGQDIEHLGGASAKLSDDDKIVIIPLVAGGNSYVA